MSSNGFCADAFLASRVLANYANGKEFLKGFLRDEFDLMRDFGSLLISNLDRKTRDDVASATIESLKKWAERKLGKAEMSDVSAVECLNLIVARFRTYSYREAGREVKERDKNGDCIDFTAKLSSLKESETYQEELFDLELENMPKAALVRALKEVWFNFDRTEVEYLVSKFKLDFNISEFYKNRDFEVKVDQKGQILFNFDAGTSLPANTPAAHN